MDSEVFYSGGESGLFLKGKLIFHGTFVLEFCNTLKLFKIMIPYKLIGE